MDASAIQSVVEEVLSKLGQPASGNHGGAPAPKKPTISMPMITRRSGLRLGIYGDVKSAVDSARIAQLKLRKKGYAARNEAVNRKYKIMGPHRN